MSKDIAKAVLVSTLSLSIFLSTAGNITLDGEKLTNGELETATQEVTRVVLLELMAAGDAKLEELPQ